MINYGRVSDGDLSKIPNSLIMKSDVVNYDISIWHPVHGQSFIPIRFAPPDMKEYIFSKRPLVISGDDECGLWSIIQKDIQNDRIYNRGLSKDAVKFRRKSPFWSDYFDSSVYIQYEQQAITESFINDAFIWFSIGQYWHFFFEDLPLIMAFRERPNVPIITNQLLPWQKEIVRTYFPDIFSRLEYINIPATIQADKLYAVSYPAISDRGRVANWVAPWLQEQIMGDRWNMDIKYATKKTYISRRDAAARRVLNEPDLIAMLKRHGFQDVTLSNKHISEKMILFASSKYVMGPTGAGLTHAIFMRPGTHVIDFNHPNEILHECGWNHIAHTNGLNWETLDVVTKSVMSPDIRNNKLKNADMVVDVDAIERRLIERGI